MEVVLRCSKNQKRWLAVFSCVLFLTTVTYACLVFRLHFSVDSYKVIYDQAAYWYLQCGRYTDFLLTLVMEHFSLNPVIDQRLFMVPFILSVAFSATAITHLFFNLGGGNWNFIRVLILAACSSIAFLNVFYMELILFPEMALFLTVGNIALVFSIRLLFSNRKASKIISLALLLIALGAYQSYVGFYMAFCFMGAWLVYAKDHQAKKLVRTSGLSLLFAGFGSVFNVLLVKLLIQFGVIADSGRGAVLSLDHILDNIAGLLAFQGDLFLGAGGLVPAPLLLILLIIIAISFVYVSRSLSPKAIIVFVPMLAVSYVAVFAPHIIESNFLLTPRSNIAFWALVSALCLVTASLMFDEESKEGLKWKICLSGAVFCLVVLQIVCIQDMSTDTFLSNEQDRNTAALIDDELDKYEKETGTVITKIAAVRDTDVSMSYPGVRYQICELNRKIMVTPYSYFHLINYIGDRQLISVEMPDSVYQEHFAGKNWDNLDLDEQLRIVNDTAYLALY